MAEAVATTAAPSNPTPPPQAEAGSGKTPPAPAATPGNPNAPPAKDHFEWEGQKYSIKDMLAAKKVADSAEQLRKASHEKFRESAEREKKLQDWAEKFEADPFEATIQYFETKGAPRAQAEKLAREKFEGSYKSRYIDPELMSPEQREAARWKSEAEKARAEKEAWEKQKQSEEENTRTAAMRETVQKEIIDTIEEHQLPKTRFIASRINFFMQQNLKHGYDAPKEVIVQQVKDEGKAVIHGLIKGLKGKDLVDWLGSDVIKELRTYDLAELQSKRKGPTDPSEKKTEPRNSSRKTMNDVDNYFNQLRRTRK